MTKTVIKTEFFEGPFDLLLRLVEDQKLSINTISLAHITDQFLQEIEKLRLSLEDLAGVIEIASTLLLIKSKTLLPAISLSSEEEGSIVELQRRLLIYQFFKRRSDEIRDRIQSRNRLYKGGYQPILTAKTSYFIPAENATIEVLSKALEDLVKHFEKLEKLPHATMLSRVYLEQKIHDIKTSISEKLQMGFNELVTSKENRLEIIIAFLALLELLREGIISVQQQNLFSNINILKAEPHNHESTGNN